MIAEVGSNRSSLAPLLGGLVRSSLRSVVLALAVALPWAAVLRVSGSPFSVVRSSTTEVVLGRLLTYVEFEVTALALFAVTVYSAIAALSQRESWFVLSVIRAASTELGNRLLWTITASVVAVTAERAVGMDAAALQGAIVALAALPVVSALPISYHVYWLYGVMDQDSRDEYLIDQRGVGVLRRVSVRQVQRVFDHRRVSFTALPGAVITAIGLVLCLTVDAHTGSVELSYGAFAASVALLLNLWGFCYVAADSYRPYGVRGRMRPLLDVDTELDTG